MTIVSPEICKDIWSLKEKGVPSYYIAREIGVRIEVVDAVLKGDVDGPTRQTSKRKARPEAEVNEKPESTAKLYERPSRTTYTSATLHDRSHRARLRREKLAKENPSAYEPLSDAEVARSMAWLANIF